MNYWDRKLKNAQPQRPLPPMPGANRLGDSPPVRPVPRMPEEDRCPECGSPNYGSPANSTVKRCFDCSAGATYRNSTSGGPPIRSEGAVKAAKQVPVKGYKPNEIVGRIQ